MSKKPALDIFRTLRAIERNDGGFYSRLEEDEQKGFLASVVMRWSSVSTLPDYDDWYLIATNRANMHLFDIADHPELQYRLLASCGLGAGTRGKASWIPIAKKKSSTVLDEMIGEYYPESNRFERALILQIMHRTDSFGEFLNGTGKTGDECKKIEKAYRAYQENPPV